MSCGFLGVVHVGVGSFPLGEVAVVCVFYAVVFVWECYSWGLQFVGVAYCSLMCVYVALVASPCEAWALVCVFYAVVFVWEGDSLRLAHARVTYCALVVVHVGVHSFPLYGVAAVCVFKTVVVVWERRFRCLRFGAVGMFFCYVFWYCFFYEV